MYSQDFIERVRESADIVDIIGQYTRLRKSGSQLVGLCPFPDHREKTASFSVSETKQVYYCFGCKKSGNVYTFLETYRGMSFPEALEYLAARAGIALPAQDAGNSEKLVWQRKRRQQMLQMNRAAADYFHKQLLHLAQAQNARDYAARRGLHIDLVKTFKVGFAPADWEGMCHFISSQNGDLKMAQELGLVKYSDKKKGYFDLFRERLMFPIITAGEEVLGFGGRSLGEENPKYLNSPETPLFSKGKVLFGMQETAKYIRSEDTAIVVEGYMDLLALYAAGIRNVVAVLGTALTADHARLLKRYCKNAILMFDGDDAGWTASERSLPVLLGAGLFPRLLVLPDQKDPDEFVNEHGAEELKSLLDKAPELYIACLAKWMVGFDGSASKKVQLADRIKENLKPVADPRLLDLYLQETAERMGVDKAWLRRATTAQRPKTPPKSRVVEPVHKPAVEKIPLKGANRAESYLLNLALRKKSLLNQLIESEVADKVQHAGVRQILHKIVQSYGQEPSRFDTLTASLVPLVDHPEVLVKTLDFLQSQASEKDEHMLMADCIKQIKDRYLVFEARRLASDLRSSVTEDKLERFMNIQKNRNSLSEDSDSKPDALEN